MTDSPKGVVTNPVNILKTRDDQDPIRMHWGETTLDGPLELVVSEAPASSWAKEGMRLGPEKLRPRIEPWLTALCQSEHLSLLIGAGLTTAVHRLAAGADQSAMSVADFGEFAGDVDAEAERSAVTTGRGTMNLEDQIRAAGELLRGYEIQGLRNAEAQGRAAQLGDLLSKVLDALATSVLQSEQALVRADKDKRVLAFNYLVSFLMSFASRTGTRDRLHIFTTNYDRYIEAGSEVAGLHLLDRFVGTLAPLFRSSRLDLDIHYNPPGIRGEPRYLEGVARFTKLHGSLDWMSQERDIRRFALPFGAGSVASYLDGCGQPTADRKQLMIYPNAAKDRETSAYPYVELFRDFAAAACRPNHTLVAFGYSFGDEHINRVIEDMLTIPSTHLVVISYDDNPGRIMDTFYRLGRSAQVSLLIGNHVGDFKSLVDHYLPKPAIDKTTFRMVELLKSRWSDSKNGDVQSKGDEGNEDQQTS